MTKYRKRPTVVVVGAVNMGLIASTNRVPSPGETLRGETFYTAPGGKGANQAVAAARMGADVRMVGRVGDDMFGPLLLQDLRGNGIDVAGVAVDSENASGIAVILLDADKQNYIVAVYGANSACDDNQVRDAKMAMVGADALLLQMEVPHEVTTEVAKIANSEGVLVILDPAPPAHLDPELYQVVDIITPNQVEAEYLTGIEVSNVESAKAAATALREKGAPIVAVKLGEMGVYFGSPQAEGHVPAPIVEPVDTVAAGDAFAGALAVGLSEGRSLEDAVRLGVAAGAFAVTKPGAQEAMPTWAEVDRMLAGGSGARA